MTAIIFPGQGSQYLNMSMDFNENFDVARKVFQEIIDYEYKKKTKPLKAYQTLSTIKLINMMYKSFDENRWVYFKEKKIISKLGK